MFFAFTCHSTVLPIYAGLRQGTPQCMDRVAVKAFGIALMMYLVCGIGGYVAFSSSLSGLDSVLEAFPKGLLPLCLQTAMVLAIVLSYPVIAFSMRKEIMFVLFGKGGQWTLFRHTGVTVGIVGFTLAMALVLPDLTTAFAWIGATVTIAMSFLLPAAVYLRVWTALPIDRGTPARVACSRVVLVAALLTMCICIANNLINSRRDVANGSLTSPPDDGAHRLSG